MMRLALTVGFCFLALMAFGVYQGVTTTRAQEAALKLLNRQIAAEQTQIKVLKADWALLTKPERLQSLVQKHLTMLAPVAAAQFTQFASLPMRGDSPAKVPATLQDVPKRQVVKVGAGH